MAKFNNLSTAKNYIDECVSPARWAVVLGCDQMFWVVTVKQASRLIKEGYELA